LFGTLRQSFSIQHTHCLIASLLKQQTSPPVHITEQIYIIANKRLSLFHLSSLRWHTMDYEMCLKTATYNHCFTIYSDVIFTRSNVS